MFVCVSDASTFTKYCVLLAGMLLLWFLLRLKVKGQGHASEIQFRQKKVPREGGFGQSELLLFSNLQMLLMFNGPSDHSMCIKPPLKFSTVKLQYNCMYVPQLVLV